MLRSQSITSFSEKKKSSFFTALRTRKSSKDLNGVLKGRPLSQSSSSMNLTVDTSAKRHSVLLSPTEDKENRVPRLRKHLSASSLKDSNRHSSVGRRKISGPIERVAPLSPPLDDFSFETEMSDRLSPYTPSATSNFKGLDEFHFETVHKFESFDWDDEPCSPSKLHRTTNMNNINDFIKTMDSSIVPMGTRASLAFEANEIELLHQKLRSDQVKLKLVENAMFLQFFEDEARKEKQMDLRFWDDIDMIDAIKNEPYGEEDDYYSYI